MTRPAERLDEPLESVAGPSRVLGRVAGDRPGPTLVCVGGIHGNEPAGVRALEQVLDALADRREDCRGELLALTGNRTALIRGCRFVDADLNRAWSSERVRALQKSRSPAGLPGSEAREQMELLEELNAAAERARGTVYVLDLHTTSGHGGAFATAGDTLRNRAFAMCLPTPLVLGLDEQVEGTLVEYLEGRGWVCASFESGQHDAPESVDLAEAAVWVLLVAAGIIPEERAPEVEGARRILADHSQGLPRVLEMRYRHPVAPEDDFVMEPGWKSFAPVREGEVLGRDRRGPVHSPESGRLLMPLYQEQGEDGFFVIREFNAVWLRVSAWLRKLGVDRIIHWLPGIGRDPLDPDGLVVNRRVARWYALDLLHLLGFRKHREDGKKLVVLRRRFDLPPDPEPGGGEIRPEDAEGASG